MSAAQIIGEAVVRLAADYDAALGECAYDERVVAFYLPSEWVILARRTCALILTEVARFDQAATASGRRRHECHGCGSFSFIVTRDVRTDRLGTECANCGMACHV
ncbi:MAG TPA: hypothetical protein VGR98_12250 [Streptosporangiaceae bacterium]|nr:hypothetical protein [Streptosporangiaceae bacterium]